MGWKMKDGCKNRVEQIEWKNREKKVECYMDGEINLLHEDVHGIYDISDSVHHCKD